MYRLQSKFLILLSVVAVMANVNTVLGASAYNQVIQIYNLMAGGQGIRTTPSTSAEIKNLTHIAIGAASSMQEADFISALIKHSGKVLTTPNASALEHYKVLIVLYFATKSFEKSGNIYDVCVEVSKDLQKLNRIDVTNLKEIRSGVSPQNVGKILTDYQFELVYSYIRQNPGQKLDANTIIDYLGNAPQFQAAPTASGASAAVVSASNTVPDAPPPAPDSPSPPPSPSFTTPPRSTSPLSSGDLAAQLAARSAKLKSTLTNSTSSTVSPSPSKKAATGGAEQGDIAAAAAAKANKTSTIPIDVSTTFWRNVRESIRKIAPLQLKASNRKDLIDELKKELESFIGAYKVDALQNLLKNKAEQNKPRKRRS